MGQYIHSVSYLTSEAKASQIYALALEGIPTLSSTTPSPKMLVVEAVKSMFSINKTLVCILTVNVKPRA